MEDERAIGVEEEKSVSDLEEVTRFRNGDESAFEELVYRYEGELYGLALRVVGNREEAMDAVQEAFLRIFRGLNKFRGQSTFRTWAYSITLNVCRSKLASSASRKGKLTESLTGDPDGDGRPASDPKDQSADPERAAMGTELGAVLKRALATLSLKHREIIVLREIEGLEYDEMASVLHCSQGTVKSRLARARHALRMKLEGVWP